MSLVLQMSDPHFGTEQPEVVQALLSLIDRVKPEVVLLSGDVTQRARSGQFERAAAFIAKVSCPVLVVPGNHDIPLYNVFARIWSPYGNYTRWLGKDLEPVYESEDYLVIGVNSTRPSRHKDGEVGASQILRVQRRLAQARPGQLRIVMLHHPVRAQEESDRANLLHGRQVAVPTWIDAGADIILGGHIHLPYILPLQGRLPEAGPDRHPEGDAALSNVRHGWVVQAGTSVSHRVRGTIPNSVNIIERPDGLRLVPGGPDQCTAERWDFDLTTNNFQRVSRQVLNLTPLDGSRGDNADGSIEVSIDLPGIPATSSIG